MAFKADKFWASFIWFWLGLATIGMIKAHLRSVTVADDLTRNQVNFLSWEPYVWEYSSTLVMLSLVFAVAYWVKKQPLFTPQWLKSLGWHFMGSMVFSLLHVLLMVLIRKLVYQWVGSHYDFGDWTAEWWYEYRKDVVTYFTLLLLIELYFYLKLSLRTQSDTGLQGPITQLKIKTQQGITLLDPNDIISVESGGNYVYIHDTNGNVLLHRKTMTQMQDQLSPAQFLRIHRSYIVNLKMINGLKDQGKDPCTLLLTNGKEVPVSRKYRKEVISLVAM
ncbi:LytR/AlgR family response regulator transcription factor [Marinicella litoralis]|uniref:LytTR family transcriptional regulator n=1 Tax=Marinicella litoralis TaxID=644220 RepID=A0A4R6XUC6_9GAMM|nr:LytTR family DNA-binding domain-containing protein [Marinicella litoralis]TDR23605.1 LytTR family transcriptional regulator [Marinicella litoralis]